MASILSPSIASARKAGRRRHASEAAHESFLSEFVDAFHHLEHVCVLLQELVDVPNLHARSLGDALLARGMDQVGIAPLLWRHRKNDRLLALELLLVDLGLGH